MSFARFASIAVVVCVAVLAGTSVFADTPTPAYGPGILPPPPAPACDSCCAPKIEFKHHRPCKDWCKCCCLPPVETVLLVKDPCDCEKYVEIPVCLPGCCTDEPECKSRCGILCKGVVRYKWCCGYHIRVVFDKCGDITVHTYGS
jgi:hypothetical protein